MTRKALLIAAAALVVMASCGSSGSKAAAPTTAAKAAPTKAAEPSGSTSGSSSAAVPTKSEIVIGTPVCLTGPQSTGAKTAGPTATAWAQWVNATQGGINGHPVRVVVSDSGCDPAKMAAVVKEMVENQHAVALVGVSDASTDTTIQPYVESKGVPVISAYDFNPVYTTSPTFFPVGTTTPTMQQAYAVAAQAAGAKTMGSIVCAEVANCLEGPKRFQGVAEQLGIAYGGTLAVSASAPNFTAECLQMQQKNVDFVVLSVAASVGVKLAQDCQLQGYNPTYMVPGPALDASYLTVKDLKVIGPQATFPYFSTDPKTNDYHAAMKQYANGNTDGSAGSQAWASLELFRKAMANAPDNPTSADVIQALYGLNGETLNGLLPSPVTYVSGQPSPGHTCFFLGGVKNGAYDASYSLTPRCYPS